MKKNSRENGNKRAQLLVYTEGKIYFSKENERKFYFLLTIIMLLTGIFYKAGLF